MPGETPTDPIADAVAGLALISSGPGLAAALACLDLKVLTGSQVVDVLKARYRQNNHDRAQLFAVIAEVLHRGQAETSVLEEYPGEFASDEVRAALVLTRRAADSLCDLAEGVVQRLPSVFRAFAAGVIDQPRVRVFRDWTCGLSDEHTAAIVAALLPRAGQLTTAQLMHEIKRHAIALDPTWARRRYERALAGRRVGGSRNEDGTANLAGYDLPVDRVAAACDRFDRLAKAAKQAGHPDPIDHVRADLFLGMTDGTYAGLTDAQILARLLAEADLTQPAPAESRDDEPGNDSSTEDPPTNNPSGHHPTGNHPPSADPSGADPSGADPPGDGPSGDGPSGGGPCGGDPSGGDPSGGGADNGRGGVVGRSSGGLRLLVGLATLAGADSRPGELLGWGAVHAELARTIASEPGASWWYVLTGAGGGPVAIGQIRSRPDGPAQGGGRGHAGLQLWLQVDRDTLDTLARTSHPPGWVWVIAEITAKADNNTGPPNGDPTARLPGRRCAAGPKSEIAPVYFPAAGYPPTGPTPTTAPSTPTAEKRSTQMSRTPAGTTIGCATKAAGPSRTARRDRSPGPAASATPTTANPHPTSTTSPNPCPAASKDEDDAEADEITRPSTEDWRNSTCMQPERPQPPPAAAAAHRRPHQSRPTTTPHLSDARASAQRAGVNRQVRMA